jgi:phosphoribosylformylglycinamidine cyclo-ligase
MPRCTIAASRKAEESEVDYKQAGVDLGAAEEAKSRIKRLARATFNPAVLSSIGSFGSLFAFDKDAYDEPLLVASTDGVGTKIQIARLMNRHDTVGYDLVAHCVDDILVQGARPLFFLDYIALGRMDPDVVAEIVSGFARGCGEFSCPLVGGETAEMPGTYAPGDYDLAGFIVGVVERRKALTGAAIRKGDALIALPSAGLHTNGYSLARKVLFEHRGLTVDSPLPGDGAAAGSTIGSALLAPHLSYLDALWPLLQEGRIAALCHITGGGFQGNIPRVLPDGLGATIRRGSWPVLPIFTAIQAGGAVADDEMFRTFNMGVGMIAFVSGEQRGAVEASLRARGHAFHLIGEAVPGAGVSFV